MTLKDVVVIASVAIYTIAILSMVVLVVPT